MTVYVVLDNTNVLLGGSSRIDKIFSSGDAALKYCAERNKALPKGNPILYTFSPVEVEDSETVERKATNLKLLKNYVDAYAFAKDSEFELSKVSSFFGALDSFEYDITHNNCVVIDGKLCIVDGMHWTMEHPLELASYFYSTPDLDYFSEVDLEDDPEAFMIYVKVGEGSYAAFWCVDRPAEED